MRSLPSMDSEVETRIVVEDSFKSAAAATRQRMAEPSPDELPDIHESLLGMIYPDGLGAPIQNVVEIVHLPPA